MKDILISAKRQKTELKWLVACFILSVLMNITAIFMYDTSWSEMYTQFLWVAILTGLFYALSVVFRILIYWIRRLF